MQFSNEYSSYILHNNDLDPILAKQKKEDQKRMQEMMAQGGAPRAKGKKGEGIGDKGEWQQGVRSGEDQKSMQVVVAQGGAPMAKGKKGEGH